MVSRPPDPPETYSMHSRSRFLILALIASLGFALPAPAAESTAKGLRYPSLTPDGNSVVFCYRGDLWIAPLDGSRNADRLTIHEEQDTLCRVSPDGKSVAFSSKRNGGYDLYTVPVSGGLPKQITFHGTVEILCEWSPDGKRLLFMSNRDPGRGGWRSTRWTSRAGPRGASRATAAARRPMRRTARASSTCADSTTSTGTTTTARPTSTSM
ncbi:MAG: hypothetical protein HC813_03660 [Planctomycetes bacterium]|nr:hypothetical protein [Planctomycetota bacterium]